MRNAPQYPSGAVAKRLGLDYLQKKVGAANAVPTFSCGDIEMKTHIP